MRTFGWVKDGKGTCSATFWQDLGKLQLRRWHGADVLIVHDCADVGRCVRIAKLLGIAPVELFKYPTIADLAKSLSKAGALGNLGL